MDPRDSPPLYTWVFVGLVLAFSFLYATFAKQPLPTYSGTLKADESDAIDDERDQKIQTEVDEESSIKAHYDFLQIKRLLPYIDNKNSVKSDRKLIVVIGSSLLREGFFSDTRFSQFLRDNGFRDTHVVVITHKYRCLQVFFPFFDTILAAKPKAIFLQSSLVHFYRPHWQCTVDHLKEEEMKEKERQIAKEKENQREFIDIQENIAGSTNPDKNNNNAQLMEVKKKIAQRRAYAREIPEFNDFLSTAKELDISVFLIDMQGHQVVYDSFPERTNRIIAYNTEKLKKMYHVKTLTFPYNDKIENFRDYRHLSEKGRNIFYQWIKAQLMEIGTMEEQQ